MGGGAEESSSPSLSVIVGQVLHGSVSSHGDVVLGGFDHSLSVLSPVGCVGDTPDGVVSEPFLVEWVPFGEVIEGGMDHFVAQFF